MSEEPNNGDRVRVTFEGTWSVGGEITWIGEVVVGLRRIPAHGGKVEILERADDPAKDPIGTWRQTAAWGLLYRKVREDSWLNVQNGNTRLSDQHMRNCRRVTVSVTNADLKVVNFGDPEPPRDRWYEDIDGDTWHYHEGERPGWIIPGDYVGVSWDQMEEQWFPLTQVVGEGA